MSGAVIFNGDYVKALKSKLKLGEAAYIETGSADPTTLSLSSPLGSLYLRSNGTLYVKYGAGASAWAPTLTTGTGGTLTSTALQDSTVYFADDTDPTKKLYFQLSGISGNTSRTLTIPNADGSVTLGTGTSNYVAYWSNTNTLTSEAQLSPTRGGTGASNTGLFSYGSNNITFTTSGSTSLTLPTSGTLATLAGAESLSNKTINSSSIGATTASSGAFTFLTLKGTGSASTAYFDFLNDTKPSSPSSGYTRVYFKSDGFLYSQNSSAVETKVGIAIVHPTTGSTFEAGSFNISMTGTNNTGIGYLAGSTISSGVENTVLGSNAGRSITWASYNTLFGSNCGPSVDANYNSGFGYNVFQILTSGNQNTAIGVTAGGSITTGVANTFIGYTAGLNYATNSSANIAIGTRGPASSTTLNGTVAIGIDNSYTDAKVTADNQFVLGTSNHKYLFPGIVETSLVLGPTGTATGQTGIVRFRELAANGTNSVGLRASDSIASDITWTLPATDGTTGQALVTNGSGTLSWASSPSIVSVTQASHGFTSADIGRPVYLNGSTYTYAQANAANTAEVAGLIYNIIDTSTFQLCLGGEVNSVGANLVQGGGSLVAGEAYFLSPTTAGKITTTDPTTVGQVSKPLGVARSSTAFDFYNMRGSVVGGANARTQLSLSNNAITTIQVASSYDAGELAGWIYIDATTDYRFYFQAQFAKKGDGTDYIIGYQTMGDVPPLGFNITITTAGLVQATLPSITGFINASVNFALNAPAVGATFPLTIGGNNIVANYKAVTATYTITTSDYYVSASGAAGYTINLPAASTVSGKIFVVKSRLNAGQVLTIDANGSETIDGALTVGLFQNESCHLVSNGTSWEMF